MMHLSIRIGCFVAAVHLSLGCAVTPPPILVESDAAIGIRIELHGADLFTVTARTVYFVRSDDSGKPVPNTAVFPSNYYLDGYSYLFGVEPGSFVAVAAEQKVIGERGGTGHEYGRRVTLFSENLVRRTQTAATAGEVIFMGSYAVRQSKPSEMDETQRLAKQVIAPTASDTHNALKMLYALVSLGFHKPTLLHSGTPMEVDRTDAAIEEFIKTKPCGVTQCQSVSGETASEPVKTAGVWPTDGG